MYSISKYIKGKKSWWIVTAVVLLLMAVIVSCSITIDSVDQADSANGGDNLPVTLNVTLSTNAERDNGKFMVAVLVPKAWNVRSTATVSFTTTITTGTQQMTAIAPGVAAPQGNGLDWPTYINSVIGNGGNLLPGWEWVAYYSNNAYNVGVTDVGITVHINFKVSQDNISFKMGYVVGNNSDGLSDPQYYASAFPGCFRVFGQGDLVDYCNPQISSVDPATALENDIITLNFDGGIAEDSLSNESNIFLCLKGVTTAGDTLSLCKQDTTTELTAVGVKKWRIDIWPRGLFKLPPDQHLASLLYYFTDRTGTIKVGNTGDASTPFTYTFKCP